MGKYPNTLSVSLPVILNEFYILIESLTDQWVVRQPVTVKLMGSVGSIMHTHTHTQTIGM